MKKFLAIVLLAVFSLYLVACGGPSGVYVGSVSDGMEMKVEIDGDRVAVSTRIGDLDYLKPNEGSFTMDGDKMIIEFDNGVKTEYTYDSDNDTLKVNDILLEKQ